MRPTDDRPTDISFRKFQMAMADPLHVWFQGGVFGDGGSNCAISGSNKSKMSASAILEKFQTSISPQRVVRFTSCFALKSTPFMLSPG